LHGRGDALVGGGDSHLLVLGDGLQLGAACAKCGDAGEVLARWRSSTSWGAIQATHELVLERRLLDREFLRVEFTIEEQVLEPDRDELCL
jgi:hypothetical protein